MHLSKTQLYACCLGFSTSSFHHLSVLIASTFNYFFWHSTGLTGSLQKNTCTKYFLLSFCPQLPNFKCNSVLVVTVYLHVIKLWCVCAAKVTVVGSVCVSVCLCTCAYVCKCEFGHRESHKLTIPSSQPCSCVC